MAQALRDAGHQVLCVNFSRQYPQFIFPGMTQYDGSEHDPAVPALLDSVNPLSWQKTAQHVRTFTPDRVILPFWSGYLAPALTAVANGLGSIHTTALLHNAIPHDAGLVQRTLSKRLMRACDAMITLSQSVSNDVSHLNVVQRASGKDAAVHTLFHPVYPMNAPAANRDVACAALGLDPNKRTLLCFGLIRPYKGHDTLIEAFNLLDDKYQLLIAGEPYMKLQTLQNSATDSARTRIHWHTRFIDDHDLPMYFGAADLVVLPYHRATQSGVTATAMHFDKPVVASNVGGLSEYIEHGRTGMLAEPNNPIAFASAIEEWFDDAPRLQAAEALAVLRKRFSWASFAEHMTDVLSADA